MLSPRAIRVQTRVAQQHARWTVPLLEADRLRAAFPEIEAGYANAKAFREAASRLFPVVPEVERVRKSSVVHVRHDFLAVQFAYSEEAVAVIKTVPGARWCNAYRCWQVPWAEWEHLLAVLPRIEAEHERVSLASSARSSAGRTGPPDDRDRWAYRPRVRRSPRLLDRVPEPAELRGGGRQLRAGGVAGRARPRPAVEPGPGDDRGVALVEQPAAVDLQDGQREQGAGRVDQAHAVEPRRRFQGKPGAADRVPPSQIS